MAGFDVEGARKAGYSDAEILQHLAPDASFDVDGALKSGYSPTEIVSHLTGAAPSAPEGDAPMTVSGSAAAAGSGLAKGLAGIPAGFIGLGNLLRKVDPLNLPGMNNEQVPVPQLLQNVEQAADQLHTPKNSLERGLKTAAEYAAPMVTGPEGPLENGAVGVAKVLAKRAMNQVALPNAGAAAAGGLTQDYPALQPYAQVGGALLGGIRGARGKPAVAATADQLGALKDAKYSDFWNNHGEQVTIDPNVVRQATAPATAEISRRFGNNAPAVSMLDQFTNAKAPVSLKDIELARQDFKGGPPDASYGVASGALDNLMGRLQPQDAVTGANQLGDALSTLKDARTLAAKEARLQLVEDAQQRATLRSNSSYSGDNTENPLRSGAANLILNKKSGQKLEPFEQQLLDINQGSKFTNAKRWVGNQLSGHNWFLWPLLGADLGLTGGAASGAAGAAIGLGVRGAGTLLRNSGGLDALNKYNTLRYNIAAGAPGVTQTPAVPFNARVPAIIAALQAKSQGQ